MNAIPNSKPENAIINAKGNNPSTKKINPEFIILYVNPLKYLIAYAQIRYLLLILVLEIHFLLNKI